MIPKGGMRVDDHQIIELYWKRDEAAITETANKYGRYITGISLQILNDPEDAAECANDTYHDAWNAIPPHHPSILSAFLGKIARRISIDRWRRQTAAKRGGGEITLALEELKDCVSGTDHVELELQRRELARLINRFLGTLPPVERQVFLRRYWYLDPVAAIGDRFGFSQSKTASMLHRTRKKLRALLEKEGYDEFQ